MISKRYQRPPDSKPLREMTPEERREYNRQAQIRYRRSLGLPERKFREHGSPDAARDYQRAAQAKHRAKRNKILRTAKAPIECPHCGGTVRLSF